MDSLFNEIAKISRDHANRIIITDKLAELSDHLGKKQDLVGLHILSQIIDKLKEL